MSEPLPCLALAGPTASGKTAAALAIAERWPVEIVSVDSALVYRGMDIGTAKPSAAELAAVPHHLIDIRDPTQAYSAADFQRDALRLIGEIRSRGRTPLLVGGTMLYFKSLQHGLDQLPGADPALRLQLEQEAARIGWPGMHAQLARQDPESAARLAPNDAQRIQRALEVIALTGTPMSRLLGNNSAPAPVDLLALALEPSQRSVLHQRIAARFNAMVDASPHGLIEEVAALRARGDLHPGLPSMRCVGYRQTWEYLDGAFDLPTLREKGIAATRQLAKRQLTWLRSMPERIVIDCLAPDPAQRAWECLQASGKFRD